MHAARNFNKTRLLAMAGIMELSLVAGQVVLAPSTITQPVTLSVGTPASQFTLSVVRTGLVTVDVHGSNSSPNPLSSIPTVFTTTPNAAPDQPFSLPTQQVVVTQAPCVSACLQEGLIASAAGPCALSSGTAVDNACACLSAPLVAIHALTNCASAACSGGAAGSAGLAVDLVAVTSLYNQYCLTAVGAEAFATAVASGQAVQASAADGSSTTSTFSSETTTLWSGGTIGNGTLTNSTTLTTNATFGGGTNPTVAPTFVDPGITTGLLSTTSAVGAASPGSKSQANMKLPRSAERAIFSLVFALAMPLLMI
ncbi:hypothetical protein BR93DRAFT_238481 [Coniochaeta sp. PMI_546]|nr:hypothetical protein BR93DRAFT_238481 [Coniochaeta sp. PMI_546]